jgi:tetratricopeptide (TPR) repeat protein
MRPEIPASPILRWILVGAGGLVLLGGLGAGTWAWLSSQQTRGQQALSAAHVLVEQAVAPTATAETKDRAVKALEGVVADYPRLPTAAQAAYELGNLHYEAGRHADARKAYELAIQKGASPSLRVLAAMGLAYSWEAEKHYDKARSFYESAAKDAGAKSFLYEDLLIGLARVQKAAGDHKGAQDTLSRALREVPESGRSDYVRALLASLQSGSPQQTTTTK